MSLKDLIPWKRRQEKQTESDIDLPLHRLQWNINRMLDEVMDEWSNSTSSAGDLHTPRIDLAENKKELLVTADMPGMDEDNIEVSLEQNSLVIRGHKKTEEEDKGQYYYHVERSLGTFYRSIPLPCAIDESKVKADYKKGVLSIHLPKAEDKSSRRKKIEIH